MAHTPAHISDSRFLRRDVVAGVTVGLAIAFVFGTSLPGVVETFWYSTALPAFYTLSQSGIGWCG